MKPQDLTFYFVHDAELLDRVRDRNVFPAVINAEMRESTRDVCTSRSYHAA
jgi:hypothetical protein